MKSSSLLAGIALLCAAPLLVVGCVTPPERGPATLLRGHGELSERVQTQMSIVDMKLAAVEKGCTNDDGVLEDRCLAPLHKLKRKRAYFRQRSFALSKTATSGSLDDVTRWQELEIEVELLTLEVDELAEELRPYKQ